MTTSLVVLAVGGNSLIKDPKRQTVPDQYDACIETSKSIADMVAQGINLVVTHGNGPQVGFILRRSELSMGELHPVPLDSCGADTQGAIGYMFQKALYNEFRARKVNKQTVTVVTQVLVDKNDPAVKNPSKPIGSFLSPEEAQAKARQFGWTVVEDAGRGFRRVVASPKPKKIIELEAIKTLISQGFIVVAAGGGGIPVVEDEQGDLQGMEAVIDKDLASALLASELGADTLLISTAVDHAYLDFGKPTQRALTTVTQAELRRYVEEGHFTKGSMLPKIQAVLLFLERGGKRALITNPENLPYALSNQRCTVVLP